MIHGSPTTASFRSSIYDVEEGGRTYHRYKQGSKTPTSAKAKASVADFSEYPLPDDEVSQLL